MIDELAEKALELAYLRGISYTMLQTELSISYARAASICDWLEKNGYVTSFIDRLGRKIFVVK